jgi:hypothetical protein
VRQALYWILSTGDGAELTRFAVPEEQIPNRHRYGRSPRDVHGLRRFCSPICTPRSSLTRREKGRARDGRETGTPLHHPLRHRHARRASSCASCSAV